ncbi:MAG: lamin tail domain-containing protein [Ignavibacteriales bacterium]|nr:lamin tail domain-containing protein [Ignavibacteriales bacterium]
MKYISMLFVVLVVVLVVTEVGHAQASVVKMNEIYSRGVTGDPDWIELYNNSLVAVNIGGYKIYDVGGQGGTKPKMTFAAGTTIPATGYLVVVTDIATTIDPSGFGLSSAGETAWLENATGAIIDSISFTAMDTVQSYSRYPDAGAWKLVNTRTRGTSNVLLKMNEIYSRGVTTDPDWIEIYNTSTVPVKLNGYKIYDVGGQGGTKPKMVLPTGTTIPAKGFLVVVTDIPTTTDPSGFGLSSGGETVWLEDSAGAIIDTVTFAAMDTVQSYSRVPDGGPWKLANARTRGKSNGTATAVEESKSIPSSFGLEQNYPNPFNPTTAISYQLIANSFVTLRVFDILGREVAMLVNATLSAGNRTVQWDASSQPSGVYMYRLEVNGASQTKKMVLTK